MSDSAPGTPEPAAQPATTPPAAPPAAPPASAVVVVLPSPTNLVDHIYEKKGVNAADLFK
jgi:hypothetical protein